MKDLETLLSAIRAVSPHAGIKLQPDPESDGWVGIIFVSTVVIAEYTGSPCEIERNLRERLTEISRTVLSLLGQSHS